MITVESLKSKVQSIREIQQKRIDRKESDSTPESMHALTVHEAEWLFGYIDGLRKQAMGYK